MHFMIAIVLLVSLCWSQVFAPGNPENPLVTVSMVSLLVLLTPLFAALQIRVIGKHPSAEQSTSIRKRLRLMALMHSITWAVSSIAIIVWLRWPDVVSQIPAVDQIPLADDLILVAPAMLSLVSSWAIFIFGLPKSSISSDNTHSSMFVFWLRMTLTFVTAPILLAFFVADCLVLAMNNTFDPALQTTVWIVAGIAAIAAALFYPQLMLWFWPTKKINDPILDERMKGLCEEAGLRHRQVRIWQTGNSIVNAAAVGMVPGSEVILVSDMLLDKFDSEEVDAVVLHELGHVWHRHSIKRTAMIVLPLLALGLDQSLGLGLHTAISQSHWLNNQLGTLAQYIPVIGYLLYLLVVIKTVFRNMEFEADRFAIETLAKNSDHPAVELALEKMAVIYPKTIDRQSGLHPSIRRRMAHAQLVKAELLERETPDTETDRPSPNRISLDPITAK